MDVTEVTGYEEKRRYTREGRGRRLADEVRAFLDSDEYAESFDYARNRTEPIESLVSRNRDERELFRDYYGDRR